MCDYASEYISKEEEQPHIKITLKSTPIILLYDQLSYNAPRDTEMGLEIERANKEDT